MGKSKNKNKSKVPDRPVDNAESILKQDNDSQEGSPQMQKERGEEKSTEKSVKFVQDTISNEGRGPNKEETGLNNGRQNTPTFEEEPENVVDKSLKAVERSWKLWTVMGVLVGMLAVLGHIEVPDQPEELVVEKGVALTESRARVFKLIGDLSTYTRWYPGVAKFDATDATPMGVGKHFTEVIEVPLYGEMHYDNVVIGYESPRYISFLSNSWLAVRVEIELERRENPQMPTGVKYRVYARCKTYLAQYVALPAMRFMYANRVRQAMFNLRFTFEK